MLKTLLCSTANNTGLKVRHKMIHADGRLSFYTNLSEGVCVFWGLGWGMLGLRVDILGTDPRRAAKH